MSTKDKIAAAVALGILSLGILYAQLPAPPAPWFQEEHYAAGSRR